MADKKKRNKKKEEVEETPVAEAEETQEETVEAPDEETAAPKEEEKSVDAGAEWKDKYVRLVAEFDNFRKRTQKEKSDLIKYAAEDTLKGMLPVLDNLQRTAEAMEKSDNLDSLKKGVEMVMKNFMQALDKQGLEVIYAKGEAFNTEIHEAITTLEAGEEMKGKVVDEVERGYKLKGKVIRYSKVVVGE